MTEVLTKYDNQWNMTYETLVEFKRKNGHCLVPFRYEQDKSLGDWVVRQRSFCNRQKMRLDRKELLDEIGFVWKADNIAARVPFEDKKWHQQFNKLVEFKQKNGHCIVPTEYEQDKALGNWVKTQRFSHSKNKMRLDRKELLDEIGFVWKATPDCNAARVSGDDKKWHQHYDKLVEWKRKNGHCIVSYRYKEDKALGRWVSNQRKLHTSNKMRQDRRELLEEIGVVWTVESLADRSSGGLDKQWHQ